MKNKINKAISILNADQWFERCWFGMFPEPTLLNHLLCWGYDPEDYLNVMDNIETAKEDKKYLEEHPEEADEEEASYLDDDIADWEEELKRMREDWKQEKESNMDEEIELLKKWVDWKQEKESNMDEEIELLKKWLKEKADFNKDA